MIRCNLCGGELHKGMWMCENATMFKDKIICGVCLRELVDTYE